MKLSVKDLSYTYEDFEKEKSKKVLSNVNLEFHSGDRVVIEGENGSGKTTFLNILSCILDMQQGEVFLDGISIRDKAYKDYMAYIPAEPIIFEELTGVEHISLICDLWNIKGEAEKQYVDRVCQMAEEFHLSADMKEKVRTYSLGTRYKLFFILMMAREPRLILLDEPFTSLDFEMQQKAVEFLKQQSAETILVMASHQKELIEQLETVKYKVINTNIVGKQGDVV